jgi:hypothetical protein
VEFIDWDDSLDSGESEWMVFVKRLTLHTVSISIVFTSLMFYVPT